jgi:hypothetical protein
MGTGARGIGLVALLALIGFGAAYAVARAVDDEESGSRVSAPGLPDRGKAPATRNLERVARFPALIGRDGGSTPAAEDTPGDERARSGSGGGGGFRGGGGGGGGGEQIPGTPPPVTEPPPPTEDPPPGEQPPPSGDGGNTE